MTSLFVSLGGATGSLGAPTGAATQVAGGITQSFENGAIYWNTSTGAAALQGAILMEYTTVGGPSSALGWPMANESALAEGSYQQFQGGKIYSTASTGAHAVTGALLQKYAALGWRLGALGWPTGDFTPLSGGGYQQFQGGTLFTSASGTFMVSSAIATQYQSAGGRNGTLGFPTTDVSPSANGGSHQMFQGGVIYWSPTTGAGISLNGPTRDEYVATGAEGGVLGYPTAGFTDDSQGGHYQMYQGGVIYWSPTTGANASVNGPIRDEYVAAGAQGGVLGYPTGDPRPSANGGTHQMYQGGVIYWSSATGANASVNGPIRDEYVAAGAEGGVLGYPTGDPRPAANGGTYQMYQGGVIYWSSATGAHISLNGATRDQFVSHGAEGGILGYPTTDITPSDGGGHHQIYQHGVIYWSPATGAVISLDGPIRDYWVSQGAEGGRFGYPTGNETSDGKGNSSQTFQHGTLYLSSGQVSTQNGSSGSTSSSSQTISSNGSSQLSSSDQALANKLTGLGFSNADSLVRASNDTKVPLGIAAALIAKESMGRNVYGSDWGGTMAGAGEVTQQNFTNQFLPAVLAGATSNGVGPTQITYSGYFRQNPNYPWWDPYSNMCFGLNIISGYLNGNYSDNALIAAGSLYNSGSTTGTASTYGASFDQLAVTYTQMLTS